MYLIIIQETSTPFEEDSEMSSDEDMDEDDEDELIWGGNGDSRVLTIGEFSRKEKKKVGGDIENVKIRPIRRDATSNIIEEKELDKE